MAYVSTIPATTDIPATSQAQILANFQAIKALVDIDHVTFNAANQGKHSKVTFPVLAASPTTLVGEVALFSRTSALTGVPELCVRKQTNGAVNEVAYGTTWVRLASGLLLKWGTTTANGLATITFPVAANIPVFTTLISVQLTVGDNNVGDTNKAIKLVDGNNLSFRVYGSARTTTGASLTGFNYLAIGI